MKAGLKLLLITLPIVLVGVGFVAFTIAKKPAPAQEIIAERAVAVRIIEASKTRIPPRASGFGLVTPARSYEAIAQVSGTAEYVNPLLKKGDILPEGAVVIRLDDSEYKLDVAQARANIRAAEARLAEIVIAANNLETGLLIEEEALELKATEMARQRRLVDTGVAPVATYDSVRGAYLAQSQKVQNIQNSLALNPAQQQAQIEQIAVFETSLRIAELNLSRTILRVPFAGRVSLANIEIGQLVRSGQTVAIFDGIDAAEVEAQIPAVELQKLFENLGNDTSGYTLDPVALTEIMSASGISAQVLLTLGSETIIWPAFVDRISNAIAPKTGTIGVIVRIDNAYTSTELGTRPPLTRGMFVETVLEATPLDAILVPRSALRDGNVMLVDAQNRLRLAPVGIYFLQGRFAVIGEGIEPGDKIVVSNPVPMMDGLLLAPVQDIELMQKIASAGAGK